MTQTIQAHSPVIITEPKTAHAAVPGAEDNLTLLVAAYDSLHNLCTAINRLNDAMRRKIMEITMQQNKGEEK